MLRLRKTILWCALIASLAAGGCFGKKTVTAKKNAAPQSAAPDSDLYNSALNDVKHGRYDVARLSLQTLINTYPDSEYLAKAKLAIADSYYKEGGTSGLTQAIAEYKDFETFFPFLDEAAYAQMQVGMGYYRMMVKPDRDTSEALNAEAELQTFVQKYPNNKLEPQAEQRLREVQEVLAEGNFRIASFYYLRGDNRAAAGRLLELVSRYPLYSRSDQANWMLGQIFERSEKKEVAAIYYANIVKDYPLSPMVGQAKAKLVQFGAPVPQPDPTALARMQQQQNMPRPRNGIMERSVGALKNGPNVSMAARVGAPNLEPPSEAGSESLTPGTMSAGGAGASSATGGATTTAVVETVTPGSEPSATATSDAPPAGSTGDAPVGTNGPDSPAQPAPGAADAGGATVGGTASGAVGNTSQASSNAAAATGTAADAATPAATGTAPTATSTATQPAAAADPKTESSSKKKKKKLLPF